MAISRKLLVGFAVFALGLAILAEWAPLRDLTFDISGYAFLAILASLMPLVGYVGIFALLLLENASVPLPAEIFLPLAGYYVFVGRMSLVGVLAVSSIASILGSVAIFLLAQKLGPSRIYWGATKLGISQRTLAMNEIRLCSRNGPGLILVSRFIPIFGSLIVLPAGALKVSFSRFALMSLVGSIGATSAYIFLGYFLGPVLLRYNELLSSIVIQNIFYALVIACSVFVAYYALRKLREKRAKQDFDQKTLKTRAAQGET